MFGFLSLTREQPADADNPATLLGKLRQALCANAASKGTVAIKQNRHDTSFAGYGLDEREEDAEVVNAIKSTPTHY